MHWLSNGPLRYLLTSDRSISPLLAGIVVIISLEAFLQVNSYFVSFPIAILVYVSVSLLVGRIKERRDMDRGLREAIRASQDYGRDPDLMR